MDFEIDNYDIDELKDIFEISKERNSNKSECISKYNNLKEKLIKDCDEEDLQNKILYFLKQGILRIGKESNIILESSDLLLSYLPPLSENIVGEKDIIVKPTEHISLVKEVDYVQGELNPLKKQTVMKILNIDTRLERI